MPQPPFARLRTVSVASITSSPVAHGGVNVCGISNGAAVDDAATESGAPVELVLLTHVPACRWC